MLGNPWCNRQGWVVSILAGVLVGCGPAPDTSGSGVFGDAYNEYTTRAQVGEVLAQTADAKIAISEYLMAQGRPPESLDAMGVNPVLAYGATLQYAQGVLRIHFDAHAAPVPLRDARIGLGLTRDGYWYCGRASGIAAEWMGEHPAMHTTLTAPWLPSSCR